MEIINGNPDSMYVQTHPAATPHRGSSGKEKPGPIKRAKCLILK